MKANHSFRVDFPDDPEADVTVLVLEEDLAEVRKMSERVLIVIHTLNLDEAKVEMANVISGCLEADNDSAYLIDLINEGHAPTSWLEGADEVLYAEEDPDNEENILLYVKAKSEE